MRPTTPPRRHAAAVPDTSTAGHVPREPAAVPASAGADDMSLSLRTGVVVAVVFTLAVVVATLASPADARVPDAAVTAATCGAAPSADASTPRTSLTAAGDDVPAPAVVARTGVCDVRVSDRVMRTPRAAPVRTR